jgi:hypothetical protein
VICGIYERLGLTATLCVGLAREGLVVLLEATLAVERTLLAVERALTIAIGALLTDEIALALLESALAALWTLLAIERTLTVIGAILAVEVALTLLESAISALRTLTRETTLAILTAIAPLGAELCLTAVALSELVVACEIGIVGVALFAALLATLSARGGEYGVVVPCSSCAFVFGESLVAILTLRVCPHG